MADDVLDKDPTDAPIPCERMPMQALNSRNGLAHAPEKNNDLSSEHDGRVLVDLDADNGDLTVEQKNAATSKRSQITCPWREFASAELNVGAPSLAKEINESVLGDSMLEDSEHFRLDVEQWISQVSEAFHIVVFLRELVGQTLFTFLGPFSLPFLAPLYGSWNALRNRAFIPSCTLPFFSTMQIVAWVILIMMFGVYAFCELEDVALVEVKFSVFCILLRQVAIGIRYAYMTTDRYNETIRDALTLSRTKSTLLLSTWFEVTPISELFFAELSFVGVLGSKSQRDKLSLKFLPYARSDEELSQLQVRMDVSSRRLILQPTGVSRSHSRHRKVERNKFQKNEFPEGTRRRPSFLQTFSFMHRRTIKELATLTKDCTSPCKDHCVVEGDADPRDKKLFDHACAGGTVPLEDVFLYLVRALLRSERAQLPSKQVKCFQFLSNVLVVVTPCLARAASGKSFFGRTAMSTMFIVTSWIINVMMMQSIFSFIVVGAKDMWRRRAMFRSCSALLTLQRFYRHGCLAEMDLLPVVDMTDPSTIEAWRKLRQLCRDWGRNFLLRLSAFATSFFIAILFMAGDLVASLEIPTYTRANDVTLTHISCVGSLLLTMFAFTGTLVYLGQDVNNASFNHSFLLQRQRLVIASQRHRAAYDAIEAGRSAPPQDSRLARATDLLDILAQDIMAEHAANPVRLLGMYCGYQLLSALYFLPAIIGASVVRFCTSDETWDRCTSA